MPNCGRPFLPEDRFCAQCGRLFLPDDCLWAEGWETCVVQLSRVPTGLFRTWRWRFVARSRRSNTAATLAESPVFAARARVTKRTLIRLAYQDPPKTEEASSARTLLVQRLVADGWEPTSAAPGSTSWYAQLFRCPRA